MKAYIERFTDNQQAVITIDQFQKEIIVPLSSLPIDAKVGTWVNLIEESGQFQVTSIDYELTNKKKEQVHSLMTNLKKRKKTSRYKK